jgi:tetrahydromethanopterin S-methyltransferase subunit F
VAQTEIFDVVLKLAGIVISTSAVGSAAGITVAVLWRRHSRGIEVCGLRGTAVGFIAGLLIVLVPLVI